MDRDRKRTLEQVWNAFNFLGLIRDPFAALLHPYAFDHDENLESRVLAAAFMNRLPRSVQRFALPDTLRDWVLGQVKLPGLFLEFGVAGGESTNRIARRVRECGLSGPVYGFDSFMGLPEDWRRGFGMGMFAQRNTPPVGPNVELVVGLFQDTLLRFLGDHAGGVSFVHIDSDLYSSAKYILSTLIQNGRLQPGSVILFDELLNYPGWFKGGEYRALTECFPANSLTYEFIAVTPPFPQAAVRLVKWRTPNGSRYSD